MKNAIITTHNLDFEACPDDTGFCMLYRIGTVTGQWGSTPDTYYIISFLNSSPNNGHLDDVFEWFEYACKRDGRNLLVLECMNERFYLHLLSKRGFLPLDTKGENCIKVFNEKMYKALLKNGNDILRKGSLTCK